MPMKTLFATTATAMRTITNTGVMVTRMAS